MHDLAFTDPRVRVDFEDDGTFAACDSPQCVEDSYNGSTIVFNVSSFTSYAAQESPFCPLNITTSTTLTESLSCAADAVQILANNVALDCNGFTITHDTGGTGGEGIVVSSRHNVTIRNCIIRDANSSGLNGIGISFNTVNNSTVTNNTLQTNGTDTNYGIALQISSNNNTVANNTINTKGANSNFGIYLFSSSNANVVRENIIRTNGTNGNMGVRIESASNNSVLNNDISTQGTGINNPGVYVLGGSGNVVGNNTIRTNGTGSNSGVFLQSSANNNTIANNIIQTNGTSSSNVGIHLLTTVSGNIIEDNVISTDGTSSNSGLHIQDAVNNTIRRNNITTQGTSSGNNGLFLFITVSGNVISSNVIVTNGTSSNAGIRLQTSVSNNTLLNNTIRAGGTSTNNHGIYLSTTAAENDAINNTIFANGTASNHGVRIESSAHNNSFLANTIIAQGTSSYGVSIADSNGSVFEETVLNDPVEWMSTSAATNNSFLNTTFNMTSGSIKIFSFSLINLTDVTHQRLNTTLNRSFLNSSNLSFLNTSAQITLNGLSFTNPRPVVDFEDDGTFALCSASQCVEDSYNGSTIVFNVSSFTSYAAQESPFCPLNITTNTTLTENVTCSATAINILADNLTLDCAGYTINYSSTTAGYGINATNRNNVTIKNCDVRQTNGSVSPAHAIFLSATENSTVINTSATANGSSSAAIQVETGRNNTVTNSSAQSEQYSGIYVTGGNNNTINNTFAASFSPGSAGIQLFSTRNNIVTNSYARGLNTAVYGLLLTIAHNNTVINTTGAGGNSGVGALIQLSADNYLSNMTFTATSGGNSVHIQSSSYNNTVENSNFFGAGNGIMFLTNAYDNQVINATINVSGSSAVIFQGALSNTVDRSVIFTNDQRAITVTTTNFSIVNNTIIYGIAPFSSNPFIQYQVDSQNSTFNNITLNIGGHSIWIRSDSTSSDNNITSTTFNTTSGSIRITNATIPNGTTVGTDNFTVTANRSFINTTILPFMNTSAQITLNSLSFTNPRPVVDFNDDGAFARCDSPQCVEDSYNGSTFVFNVSSFTSYAAQETPFCPLNITSSTTLGENVSCLRTAVQILADNVVLDCAGYNISFAGTPSGSVAVSGINVSGRNNVTVRNCVVSAATTKLLAIPIQFESSNNSRIENSTANARGSSSPAISVSGSQNMTVVNSTGVASGAGSSGVAMVGGAFHVLEHVEGNTSISAGIELSSVFNSTVRANSSGGGGGSGTGILFSLSENNTVVNSTAQGGSISLHISSSANNTVQNVSTQGSSVGIQLSSAQNNTLSNVSITGQIFFSSSNLNVIGGVNGSGMSRTVQFSSSHRNSLSNAIFQSTIVNAILLSASSNNTFVNVTASSTMESVVSATNSNNNTFINLTAAGGGDRDTVSFSSSSNNTIVQSNLTHSTTGPPSSAYVLGLTTSAQNVFNDTVLGSDAAWMSSSGAGNILDAVTFNRTDGSILMTGGAVNVSDPVTITFTNLNILSNQSFLNSTNISFLNTSAQITLNGLVFANPRLVVDFDDDGSFAPCSSPQCVEDSYAGGIFIFNVSSFTSYAAAETNDSFVNITFDKIDSSDPIASGGSLTYTVQINNTGNGTANNLTVVEIYPSGVAFVSSSPVNVDNTTFNLGSLGPNSSTTLNITVNVSALAGTILNNSINLSFFNGTDTINGTDSELTNVTAAAAAPAGGGGGGGGAAFTVNVPIVRNATSAPAVSFPVAPFVEKTPSQESEQPSQEVPSELPSASPSSGESVVKEQALVSSSEESEFGVLASLSAQSTRAKQWLGSGLSNIGDFVVSVAQGVRSRSLGAYGWISPKVSSGVQSVKELVGPNIKSVAAGVLLLVISALLTAFVVNRQRHPPLSKTSASNIDLAALRADLRSVDKLLKKHNHNKQK